MTRDSIKSASVNNSVNTWLSTIPLPLPPECPSKAHPAIESAHRRPFPAATSNAPQSRKRKADDLDAPSSSQNLPCSRRRLTRQALREIEANMAPGQETPKRKKASYTGMNTPQTSETGSRELTFTCARLTASAGNIREALDDAGMRYGDEDAWDRYPEFRETIEAVLDIPRGSSIGDESLKQTNRLIKEKRFLGEATFLKKVFPAIVPTTHTVETGKRSANGDVITAVRDYEESDDLEIVEQPHFSKGFVPGKAYGKKDKEFGLTEPVPDQAYGKRKPLHKKGNDAQLPAWLKAIKSLNTKTEWPFLVLEGKTKEPIAVAENQAIRDGAAIVNSRLMLKGYVNGPNYKEPLGADPEIFVFSICFGPDFSRIAVHWFEKLNDEERYFHMTPVGQYFINEKPAQAAMRSRIHNIWDYGLVKYHFYAEQTYQKAVAKYRKIGDNGESVALAEAVNAGTDTSSSIEAGA